MSRFLYRNTLPAFLDDVDARRMEPILAAGLGAQAGVAPSSGEQTSWTTSLPALADVLRGPALATSQVFVELFMPLTSRRCDVLLTGKRADGGLAAVLLELKQWSHAEPGPYAEHIRLGHQVHLHPSAQARDYVEHLRFFHSAFTEGGPEIRLEGAVYLHLMPQGRALQLLRDPSRYGDLPRRFPLFAEREAGVLARWLEERLVPGPGLEVADRIAAGRPRPSPKLLDLVVQTIQDQHEWKLLDEQRTVYWAVRDAVQKAKDTGEKKVIVVRGGPGTGKSVLAIQLLADAARQGWRVAHATGSKAFQTVLQGKTIAFANQLLKRIHNARFKNELPVGDLFTTFAEVARAGAESADVLDLVVADEAHRLWERRRMKYPNGTIRWLSDAPMVREVIAASRVTAFFLDDNQSVRSGEIGHSRYILHHAAELGIPVEEIDLNLQFRCGGSESYIHWTDGLLGFRPGYDLEWRRYGGYDLRLVDDVPAMDRDLRRLAADGHTCRIVAGYCWRWSKPQGNGALVHDVNDPRFEGWSGPWIAKTGQHLKPLDHQYFQWATQAEKYEEVGSIYSVQGFEFDHVGLIWGEDLVWRDGRWVAQLDRNKDHAFKKELRTSGEDPVAKLRNVYRVLLTRGMRGTFLFVLDEETRAHVQACLQEAGALGRVSREGAGRA